MLFRLALRPRCRSLLAATGLLLATPIVARADTGAMLEPFASANRNPFVQVYGLPTARSARLAAPGQSQFALQLEAANSFTVNSGGNESILIDGESYRANLQWRRGVGEHLEVGLDLPYLSHDPGSMDSFIEDWHNLFGFPDGDRPDFPRDQLRYAYGRGEAVPVNLTSASSGVGDASLNAAYGWSTAANRRWALRGQVKLPTGDAEKLLGSESTDLALGLHFSDSAWRDNDVAVHASLGALWMDEGDVLDTLREDWAVYGSSTLAWQTTENVSLKLQLDAHTALYDSELEELGSASAQLILGGALRLGQRWVLDLAVSEDIVVDTAPDVVFMIGLTFDSAGR